MKNIKRQSRSLKSDSHDVISPDISVNTTTDFENFATTQTKTMFDILDESLHSQIELMTNHLTSLYKLRSELKTKMAAQYY